MQTTDVGIGSDNLSYNPDFESQLAVNLAAIRAANAKGLKVIVRDANVYNLQAYTYEQLTSAQFNSRGNLKDHLKVVLTRYCYEPGFYGVVLGDEPSYDRADEYGVVYKAIKDAASELGVECYVHINLLPFSSGGFTNALFQETDDDGNKLSYTESYEKYLNDFITAAKATELCIDIYPFRGTGVDVYDGYLANMQSFAKVCKENNVEMVMALQTYADLNTSGSINHGVVDEEMMRAQISTCVGFGITRFSYFRYASNQTDAKVDDGFFINSSGQKTDVYTAGKKIMAELKGMEQVILNYEFLGSNYYGTPAFESTFDALSATVSYSDKTTSTAIYQQNTHTFAILKDVTSSNDIALVTELKDVENGLYAYMAQNFIDSRNVGDTTSKITLDFGSTYSRAVVFRNGVRMDISLINGKYSVTLDAGEAVYIIPLIG